MTSGTLKRIAGFIGVLVLLFLLAGLLILNALGSSISGSAPHNRPELQGALVNAAERAGNGGSVALDDVLSSDWDQVWVWDGYSADRDHTVFPHVDFGLGGYGTDYVIAFAKAGELVAWVRFNINDPIVYFDPGDGAITARRDEACFLVTSDADHPAGYVLVLGPPDDCEAPAVGRSRDTAEL